MLTYDSEEIFNYSLTDGRITNGYVLSTDLTIFAFKSSDSFMIFMTCFSALLVFLFIIFPVFLLFFYPTKILRKLLSKCLSNRLLIFLNTFIEKFHCCYKDGLDDTKDMRSFLGIYFLLRIIIYFAETINMQTLNFNTHFTQGFMFSVTALIVVIC